MDGGLTVFVLATAISVGISRAPSSQEQGAYTALMKATYIQTGLDKQANKLEKKYVSKEVEKYAGWITLTGKVVSEKRIAFQWTF